MQNWIKIPKSIFLIDFGWLAVFAGDFPSETLTLDELVLELLTGGAESTTVALNFAGWVSTVSEYASNLLLNIKNIGKQKNLN